MKSKAATAKIVSESDDEAVADVHHQQNKQQPLKQQPEDETSAETTLSTNSAVVPRPSLDRVVTDPTPRRERLKASRKKNQSMDGTRHWRKIVMFPSKTSGMVKVKEIETRRDNLTKQQQQQQQQHRMPSMRFLSWKNSKKDLESGDAAEEDGDNEQKTTITKRRRPTGFFKSMSNRFMNAGAAPSSSSSSRSLKSGDRGGGALGSTRSVIQQQSQQQPKTTTGEEI